LKEDRDKDCRFVDWCCSWRNRGRDGLFSGLPMGGLFQRNINQSLEAGNVRGSVGLATTYGKAIKEVWD
jgi:hypothetical protein